MSETMMLHSKRTIDHLIAVESELVNVVEKTLRQIIGELDQSEVIKKIVSKYLGEVKAGHSMTLKVHADMLESIKEKFSLFPEDDSYLNIISDITITDTDAFTLETPSGNIDSGISIQLEMLVNLFKDNF